MALSIDTFRAQAAALDNASLQVNQQGEGLEKSGKGSRIASFLGIGNARETNARTVDALRQAVHNDPKYSQVTEQADALLGRMTPKKPLNGRQVSQFLATLDAAAQKNISLNRGTVYTLATHEISGLDSLARRLGGEGFSLSPKERTALSHFISDRILEFAGDFNDIPDCEQRIRDIAHDAMQKFIDLREPLDASTLPQEKKAVLLGQIFENAELMPRETLEFRIRSQETYHANTVLQQSLSDVSSGDTPLCTALTEAMGKAGITADLGEHVLRGMGAAVESAIDKAGRMGGHLVSREEGEAIVATQVKTFIEAYQAAGTLGSPAEQACMRNLVLTSPTPISAPYLHALSERATTIPAASFNALANATTPAAFMEQLESISRLLQDGFHTMGQELKLEGADGHASYMEHCLELALTHTGMTTEQARTLFDALNTPMHQEMRDMLNFGSAGHESMASSKITLLTTMQALGRLGGADVDAFMGAEFARPAPQSASELSLGVASLLPDFSYVESPIPLGQAADPKEALRTATQQFTREMSRDIQTQMMHHAAGYGRPVFEKDITRGGLTRTIDGTKLQPFNEIPEEALLLPGETSLGEEELLQRRKDAAVTNGYNAFAKLVTSNADAVFSDLSPQDKAKVFILTSMANQELEKTTSEISQKALLPNCSTPRSSGDFTLTPPFIGGEGKRDVYVDVDPNGDFVIQLDYKLPVQYVVRYDANKQQEVTIDMDPARSSMSAVSRLTISQAEMERLSQLNWNLPPEEYRDLPGAYTINFSQASLLGGVHLVPEQ